MKTASARRLLQSAVGREYGNGQHCWEELDELFSFGPHVTAAAAIGVTAIYSYQAGTRHLAACLAVLALQLMSRAGFKLAYDRRGNASLDVWLRNFWFAASSSGLLWGLALSLLLVDATPEVELVVLLVGYGLVQATSARAYMAPAPAITQSLLLLAMVVPTAFSYGNTAPLPLAILMMLFQFTYIRRLIAIRLNQLRAEDERSALFRQLGERNLALQHANEQLSVYATTDKLTDLPNRRQFDRRLAELTSEADRANAPLSLALIDVDHFKRFNDTHGHIAGDGCLATLGKLLRDDSRSAGLVAARYGGEEFALIMPGADAESARATAEHLRGLVQAFDFSAMTGDDTSVTISIGIATRQPGENLTEEQLIAIADRGLYAAKHAGRNCVCQAPRRRSDSIPPAPSRHA